MITLRNDFHQTHAPLSKAYAAAGPGETQALYLSPRVVTRLRRTLCGVTGCTCGDALGCRGPQGTATHQIQIQACQDGGVVLYLMPVTSNATL